MGFWARVKTNIRTIGVTSVLAGVMSLTLVACGGEPGTTTGSATATAPGAAQPTNAAASSGTMSELQFELSEWAINPKEPSVSAGKYMVVANNVGELLHNILIVDDNGQKGRTPNFSKADSPKSFEVELTPGTYKLVCDLPGHEQSGMVGSLTVK